MQNRKDATPYIQPSSAAEYGSGTGASTPDALRRNPAKNTSNACHWGIERGRRWPRAAKEATTMARTSETASLASMNHSSVTKPTFRVTDPIADRYPIDVAAFDSPKPHADTAAILETKPRITPPPYNSCHCIAINSRTARHFSPFRKTRSDTSRTIPAPHMPVKDLTRHFNKFTDTR